LYILLSYQLVLIADPYSDHRYLKKMMRGLKRKCLLCKIDIEPMDLHKIVMYVVQDEFTDHYYEHIECPDKFTV